MVKSKSKSGNPTEGENVKDEFSDVKYEKRPSHLYFQDKNKLRISEDLSYKQLTHLYLHNNQIENIENLDGAIHLKELYLHNNNIKKICNLEKLVHLRRLHLGHNEICVVEGLSNLRNLEELYIEKQRLRESDCMCFDPRSVSGIKQSLRVLNCCRNNITDISNLAPLTELRYLDVSQNSLSNIQEVCDVLRNFFLLENLIMSKNPISKLHKYRESLIGCTTKVKLLDNKLVNDLTRVFIRRMEHETSKKRSEPTLNLPKALEDVSKNYPEGLQKSITRSILEKGRTNLTNSVKDTIVGCGDAADVFLPMKKYPKPKGVHVKKQMKFFKFRSPKMVPSFEGQPHQGRIQDLVFVRKVKTTSSLH